MATTTEPTRAQLVVRRTELLAAQPDKVLEARIAEADKRAGLARSKLAAEEQILIDLLGQRATSNVVREHEAALIERTLLDTADPRIAALESRLHDLFQEKRKRNPFGTTNELDEAFTELRRIQHELAALKFEALSGEQVEGRVADVERQVRALGL